MNTIEEVEKALITAAPGTVVNIEGYENGKGEIRDHQVELLGPDAYWEMQREDLKLLQEADVADLFEGDLGDLQATDLMTARDQMIEAKATAIKKNEVGVTERRGPAYESIGGSLERLPTNDQAIYLQRVKILGEPEESKPAKGAVPRAKQQLALKLDLPSRRYVHTLKFEDGKFKDLKVEKMVEGSPLAETP